MDQEKKFLTLAGEFRNKRKSSILEEGVTYDDILLLPGRSTVDSPDQVSTASDLSNNIRLESPIVSANMDSVTEEAMAIAMALNGGIGALHRAMPLERQIGAIQHVKSQLQYIIDSPPIISPCDTIGRARELMELHQRGYVVVMDQNTRLNGIITTRDLRWPGLMDSHQINEGIFTSNTDDRRRLVTAPPNISMEEAQRMMWENRVEKLLLVDSEGNFGGVITDRDIRMIQKYPQATKDFKGRLQVLGSVGVGDSAVSDAIALIEAGADGIIIDVLHGDTPRVLSLTSVLRAHIPTHIPVIVGNVATEEQTEDLAEAGADVIKVGWGPGSFCTTRIITATGAAQFSAVVECAAAAYLRGKKVIADGGVKYPADLVKALFGGAAAVMMGGVLVGADESPGQVYIDEMGKHYKLGRGSASETASKDFAKAVGRQAKRRAPQGVQGVRIKHTGPVGDTIFQYMDGARNGIAAVGAKNIDELQLLPRIQRQSAAAIAEGQPHAIGRQ